MYRVIEHDRSDCVNFTFHYVETNSVTQHPNVLLSIDTQNRILDKNTVYREYIPHIIGRSQYNIDRLYRGDSITDIPGYLHATVWQFLFRRSILTSHNILFNPRIRLNEDSVFIIRYLAFIEKMSVISAPLYFYRVSNNGSMATCIADKQGKYANKIELVEERSRLANIYFEKYGFDLMPLFSASCVLSAFELAITYGSKDYTDIKTGFHRFRNYCRHPTVELAFKNISTKGAPLRYRVPILLIRHNCFALLFGCIRIASALKFKFQI